MTWIAALIALPLAMLNLAFAIEVAVGLRAGRRRSPGGGGTASAVIVMPAHDEAPIIARAVAGARAALATGQRLLVVADNCRDETAALAEAAGAEVVRRDDPARRGKGYALAFARDHLALDPPQAAVVLDADCTIDRGSLAALVDTAVATGRPVQAVNLLRPDRSAAPMVQVSTFAFMVKNRIRQAALARIADRVHLTGTGMAFPWALFRDAPLATGDAVEDLGLGLDLAAAGNRPLFATDATVWSSPESTEGTLKQRTRWEGGFLATSLRRALPTLGAALARGDVRGAWWGLSLAVPPVTLLVLANAAVAAVVAVLTLAGAAPWPLIAQVATGVASAVALLAAWRAVGRDFLSPAAALRAPVYLLWKVPMYLGLLRGSGRGWLRAR